MTTTGQTIVPRWEWRTFGERFVSAEQRFGELSPERVQESVDLYLVAASADHAVKVRDESMDVKHLERVDENGLEQWLPVMKAGFPLAVADLARLRAALGEPGREGGDEAYSLEEALADLTGETSDVVAVEVAKRRVRYTVGGCLAELTEVHTEHGPACSIAIESEDPARVVAAVRELGLGSLPNVSYPRWLAMLVGLVPARFAVIDVGTNSVKFHVGERGVDGAWGTVVDRAEVTRLGEGLDRDGALDAEPMERTTAAIAAMVDEGQQEGALGIVAVGTAGLRIAGNSAEFVDAVEARCGVRIEVISGEDEARLAYLATTSALGLGASSLVVFDTGGGSSQFTFGTGSRVDERFSVDVGAARFTERFGLDGPVSREALQQALTAIGTDLERLDGRPAPDALVGMGGAMTNLAAVKHGLASYDPEVVHGTVLDVAEIERQIELYRTSTADERRAVVGLQPNRAEVILAGACIVRTVMAKLGADRVTVSDRGLRHGLLVERFGLPAPEQMKTETNSGGKMAAVETQKRLSALTGEELKALLALIRGADSVELKVTVPDTAHRSAVRALGIDPLDVQIRQVFFFDTPDLRLNAAGVVVRARRIQGKSADTVVKLRPVVPEDLPDDLRRSPSVNVEVDAMPTGYVCSASIKGKASNEEVLAVSRGERPLPKLFTKEQRAFLEGHAPEGLDLGDLRVLGPVFVLKDAFVPPAYGRRFVTELWLLPDGSRILELSTKCAPAEAFQIALETRAFLESVGIDLGGTQATKTKSALDLLAAELRSA